MSGGPASSRFAAIYDSLPPDVQHAIVGKQLIPLLDLVSKTKRKRVLASAAKMQRRHAGIPVLDLKAKQREVNALLDELHRDAKRSFVKERSHRTELIEQTVESVTSWLNDIWCIVYEHNVDFLLAHRALIFVVNVLDQIAHGRASCRCAFTSMYVPITLKRRCGKLVKSWELNGAHHIEEVLQFIWRDLFLSMLASGSKRHLAKIPEMLDDIEDLMGWTSLERLVFGGRKCKHDHETDDGETDPYAFDTESDVDEEEEAFTDEDSDLDAPVGNEDWIPKVAYRATPEHAKHWSHRISSQMWQFRRYVQSAMTSVFKITPSLRLYLALRDNSTDPMTTEAELKAYLSQMATSCPEVFSAALEIYACEKNADKIAVLLKTHAHLIRPRDASVMQSAVATMASNAVHLPRALEIIEKELLDTAHAVHAALLGPFSQLETDDNRGEIEQIVKLRQAAAGRQDRVERWVDAVCTPGMNAPNPMALAAMVMGLPIMPAMDGLEDADPLGYLDLDPSDPDMEDLREEFRPRLKNRFEGWSDTAITVKGGPAVLQKVYKEVAQQMPFLRASDVVEDMLGRLADKPSKQYLVDAVDALSAFVKVQRRKAAAAKNEQKRRANATIQTSVAGPSSRVSASASTSASNSTIPSPAIPPTESMSAGTSTYASPTVADDLPSRPETPPPPLEPFTPAPASLFTFYTGHIAMPQGVAGPAGGGVFGGGGGPGTPGGGGFGAGGGLGPNGAGPDPGFGGAFGGFGDYVGGFGGMEDVD
ncbi:uncharacterized protein TRAVEDRAFT_45023 [Trametes versicolor FP-101664 SS1]|uniref:uncharacterized protein n=1 Tax=Trametes versicolor (strain FP-101664) TaxID=717944 RepID=UPI000462385A|nr:uncharacterized protein TRAVEDRAFT_45023 [Trametes versicolor FP-101664 SS1]EIW62188.1 hypothetical protein TRAVEDRAFT_45023 [Trametes versicolor FP-101664 SS1]